MWIVLAAAAWTVGVLFVWSLCRAAADADRRMEQTLRRHAGGAVTPPA